MTQSFAGSLDALSGWRSALVERLDELSQFLTINGLIDESMQQQVGLLRARLGSDKLIVAFVAEFSRGKSELINSIFFSDTGRRILPATPGRTTMSNSAGTGRKARRWRCCRSKPGSKACR
jgi:hypothetical protein